MDDTLYCRCCKKSFEKDDCIEELIQAYEDHHGGEEVLYNYFCPNCNDLIGSDW